MTDFGGAAEEGYAAAAIEFKLHAGVRHFVPVNGQTGAGEIRGAGDAEAAAFGEFAEIFFPVGRFDDAADAFGKIYGAEAKEIRGDGVGGLRDAETVFGGVDG